jgi:hypothetical protein
MTDLESNRKEARETDESYRRRLHDNNYLEIGGPALVPDEDIDSAVGDKLDRIGEALRVTRKLKPVSLSEVLSHKDPALMALGLHTMSTTQSANFMNDMLDSERQETMRVRAELRAVQDDLHAVSLLHKLLAEPRYARRLVQLILDAPDPYDVGEH